ncbi:hypothetical protein HYPBUDRAFT_140971 [Hyphopichia burtonii NRRL Y-1933]|uniref:STAS domain-containing protein n=1 Tax=Hyphopichia burtonii NRRL Y-1933 TaxID=984485 RepID=A0A1E4RGX2_9ASCO|nr:hypothetical protein HYPBUDRAFT_140971 [Hyphopichia burtonii NRRL Y-1933]ODV66513.1 hypothetical protein HYPBUDRAFT_140971 [Hyphopichia burtonii NRRL Y-1933]
MKVNDESKFNLVAYISYYCPIIRWLPSYSMKNNLLGDFLAGVSMASFQIPYIMSITQSLAHLPPLLGLYSVIAGAFVYSIMGSVPVLVVGPAPSTALIYGNAIETIQNLDDKEIAASMSFCIGGILLGSGICRLGFLNNLLSRALLKGFIGAMGLIMIINELSIELGLHELSKHFPHKTTWDKIVFLGSHLDKIHWPTLIISSITLSIVLVVKSLKARLIKRYQSVVYFPELLLMVVVGTFLSYTLDWEKDGIDIVGDITSSVNEKTFLNNPFKWSKINLYKEVFATSFICSILGYFDSSTASKALEIKYNYNISSNRELVALGLTNLSVCFFGGLPCFGALGRSKINLLAGASSPMSVIIMAITVGIGILYLLPFLYYLPECILALSTTIIGITVLEEVPHDLRFYWQIAGYDEIFTFSLIFLTSVFWSAQAGVTLGIILAIIKVIRYSTHSNIQILGRIPNTSIFRNADELIEESFVSYNRSQDSLHFENLIHSIEQIEGILIIKIPESLNFANVGDLKNRLNRIEKYGTLLIHPSQPSIRDFNSNIKFIIFDCKGMNDIDTSATQLFKEILSKYCEDNIHIFFTRVSNNKKLRTKFTKSGIKSLVNENFSKDFPSFRNTHPTNMGDGFYLSIEDALKSVDLQNV